MKRTTTTTTKRKTTKRNYRAMVFALLAIGFFSMLWASGLIPGKLYVASAQTEDDTTASRAQVKQVKGISPEAARQIAALQQEKESRTLVQRKIDSQLLYKSLMRRGLPVASDVPTLETRVEVDPKGFVAVDISARVTKQLLGQLRRMNAKIISVFPQYHSITAQIQLSDVEALAARDDVEFIQPLLDYTTNKEEPPVEVDAPAMKPSGNISSSMVRTDSSANFVERSAKVREYLSKTLAAKRRFAGSVVAESDRTHRADVARQIFNTDGTGIKIGVISNGVATLAARQATGDLPATVTVLPGQAGSGDEGTAMLEIVHDVAPGAQLFYATALPSITQFATNIKALRTAGCDIIIDDISYFVETPFQDGQDASIIAPTNGGIVVQAVKDVTVGSQAGALYFSSAANSGNKNDNTAGAWEGDFADGGPTSAPLPAGNQIHDFGGGATSNLLTVNGRVLLKWSDPLGGSGNDYDVYALNTAGTAVVAAGTNTQDGNDDPVEDIGNRTAGQRIVIVKKAAAASRFLHLNTNRGVLAISTAGVVYGHNAGRDTISVAATPAGPAQNNAAIGPFPNAHSAANVVEQFSSDGPRRIFYNADGTLITPGNVSSTGGEVLQKPDITAADGVTTTTPGFIPFFGTSAAAPQAGAMMALLKAASPGSTSTQLYNAMTSTAIDIEAAGTDRDSGAGIFMPIPAISSLGIAGPAFLELGATAAAEAPGDGDGKLEGGEGATLNAVLNNIGPSNATGITATLTTTTPGVTISNPNVRSYADLAAFTGTGSNSTPWRFTLQDGFVCGTVINFTLTVNYSGGAGTQVLTFSIETAQDISINSTLDTTAPTAGNGYTATTGLQNLRLTRNSVISTCAAPKPAPTTFGTGTRQYDAYVFTAVSSGCVTVTLSGANAIRLFSTAYSSAGFDPSNITANYLADAGASSASRTYSFNVTAGQTFTIVVNEVDSGAGIGVNYNLNVSGVALTPCDNPNHVPTAIAQNVTVNASTCTTANVPASAVNNGSFDPDGPADIVSMTLTPSGPFPIGTTNVILTVTDSQGAQSQANATVTVVDPPPTINPIANVVATLPNGSATSMPVTFPLPTATDNCPGVTVTTSPVSGSVFNVGTTTVNVTATDSGGHTSTATFTVTVLYPFAGFTGRVIVNQPGINYMTAGNTTPIRFSLGGNRGLNIFASGSPSSRQVACPAGSPIGGSAPATLSPGLFYQAGQYTMYWQTSAAWAGTCRQFDMTLKDGSTRSLNFWFYQ